MPTLCGGVRRVAPLQVLQIQHPLAIEQIGKGPLLAARLVRAVELDVQLVFDAADSRIRWQYVDDFLVVAVQKVDHQPAHAPGFVLRKGFLQPRHRALSNAPTGECPRPFAWHRLGSWELQFRLGA